MPNSSAPVSLKISKHLQDVLTCHDKSLTKATPDVGPAVQSASITLARTPGKMELHPATATSMPTSGEHVAHPSLRRWHPRRKSGIIFRSQIEPSLQLPDLR